MTPFEYLLLLAAIILGLAITDLSVSVHRLLTAGARVKWDWLAPIAALVAFLKIVTQWWSWFDAEPIASGLTFEMFLGVLASAVLLFLLAAAALPDDFSERAVDLRAHYALVARRYWLLFAAQEILTTGVSFWAEAVIGKAHVNLISPVWLVPPIALSLAFIKNRWWHTARPGGLHFRLHRPESGSLIVALRRPLRRGRQDRCAPAERPGPTGGAPIRGDRPTR